MHCLSTGKKITVICITSIVAALCFMVFYGYIYRQIHLKLNQIRRSFDEEQNDNNDDNVNHSGLTALELRQITLSIRAQQGTRCLLVIPWVLSMVCCTLSVNSFGCDHKVYGFLYFAMFSFLLFSTSMIFNFSLSKSERLLGVSQLEQI